MMESLADAGAPIGVFCAPNILDAPYNAIPASAVFISSSYFFDMSSPLINNIRIYVPYNFQPHPRQNK